MYDCTQQYLEATVPPPDEHYDSSNVLVKQINDAISDIETTRNSIRFSYYEISKNFTIVFDEKIFKSTSVAISNGLSKLLGFEHVAVKKKLFLMCKNLS